MQSYLSIDFHLAGSLSLGHLDLLRLLLDTRRHQRNILLHLFDSDARFSLLLGLDAVEVEEALALGTDFGYPLDGLDGGLHQVTVVSHRNVTALLEFKRGILNEY